MSNKNSISGPRKIHYNIPQLLVEIISTQILICIWGRATGKTEGPGGRFTLRNALTMPRSLGGIVSMTFDKMLMFIIPKLVKSWEKFGYSQDLHFWVRKFAPKELRRERPYLPVSDSKYFIHWFNGSGMQLISLDRIGISNASDLDYIYGDEARFFKEENFQEVINANRGNAEHFGHLSQHHSILLTTDMPRDNRGRWLFQYYDQVDQEIIDGIMMVRQRVQELEEQIRRLNDKYENPEVMSDSDRRKREKVQKLIDEFEIALNELRKGTIFVSEASTLDNIDALGIDAILNFKRNLSDYVFRLSVLNERIAQIENGFYGMFDESKHCYTSTDHNYLQDLRIDDYTKVSADCRWYRDYDLTKPLHIACDHNAAINWIVTGQVNKSQKICRQLNAMFVERPLKIRHLVNQWHQYHKYLQKRNKVVNFWYDHTSIADNASKDVHFADEIVQILEKLGWSVRRRYIGRTPYHRLKYEFWNDFLEGKREDGFKFMINEATNQEAILCLQTTEAKIGKDGFEKDKSKEKDRSFPQVEAPHVTEAMDTLWWGILESESANPSEFMDTLVG